MEHALRTYRERHDLTLPALAERAGVPKSTLSRIENRETVQPTPQTMQRLIKATQGEVTAQDFLPPELIDTAKEAS